MAGTTKEWEMPKEQSEALHEITNKFMLWELNINDDRGYRENYFVQWREKIFTEEHLLSKVIQDYFDNCIHRKPIKKKIYDENWDPKKWTDGKELTQVYWKYEIINHPTTTWLARMLWMTRRTLTNYGKEEKFFPTIEAAKKVIEEVNHIGLLEGKNNTWIIFNLLNNHWWKSDKDKDDWGIPMREIEEADEVLAKIKERKSGKRIAKRLADKKKKK